MTPPRAKSSTDPVKRSVARPLGSDLRDVSELHGDEGGQLTTEWVLLVATVIVPIGLLCNGGLIMLRTFLYRVTGTITLPFL